MKPVVALFVLTAVSRIAGAATCGAEEAILREIKLKAWPNYYRTQDAAGLGKFLLEDFRIVGGDGSVSSRAEELAWVAKSPWNPKDFTYTISNITCPGPAIAIIVGEGRFKGQTDGAWYEHRYVSSNILLRLDGRWRAALSHISGERSDRLAN